MKRVICNGSCNKCHTYNLCNYSWKRPRKRVQGMAYNRAKGIVMQRAELR